MTLDELQRIKQWHVAHKAEHPLEYHLWDAMLTLWMMGWIGWIPAWMLSDIWALPLCVLGVCAPGLYMAARARAHLARRVRCDWLPDA